MRVFFRLFYGLSIYGIDSPYQGKAILAPNHASFFDPPVIGAAWPEEVHFLARANLFHLPIWGRILSKLNAHPIHGTARDVESFRLICQLLSEGKKVVIFPEGNRTETGQLQEIKSGFAMLALRMHCPIIPVYIKGTFEAWPRHNYLPRLGPSIACVFGQPIFPEISADKHKKKLQETLTQQVQEKMEELRLWLEAGAQGQPP
jgi:1-acyl-sn-glycerol-3-phosphate acyltransferase